MVPRGLSCTGVVDSRGLDSSHRRRVAGAARPGRARRLRRARFDGAAGRGRRGVRPIASASSRRTTTARGQRPRRHARWSGARRRDRGIECVVGRAATRFDSPLRGRVARRALELPPRNRAGAWRSDRDGPHRRRSDRNSSDARVARCGSARHGRVARAERRAASAAWAPPRGARRLRDRARESSGWKIRRTRRDGSCEIGFATTSCRRFAA